MNNIHFSVKKESLIKIQRIIKSKIKDRNYINKILNNIYSLIYGIMKRIYNSFLLGIINQYDYNSYMSNLDEILCDFKSFKRPISIKDSTLSNKKKINNLTEKIRNNLILLTQKCGFKNIMDGFSLILGEEKQIFLNNLEYKELNLVKFYNNVFIPISFDFYTMDLKKNNDVNDLIIFNKKLEKESFDFKNINKINGIRCLNMQKKKLTFIEEIQGGRLYIPLKKNNRQIYFVFDGYFVEDPLNMSRLGGIYETKNIRLQEKVKKLEINNYFKKAFLQQIPLRDFIVYTEEQIINKCFDAFQELKILKKKTISSLVKDFLACDISKQRDILTLFLLMKDDIDTQYLAYLMYDMISNESYLLKPQPLAEQVYNSLHWTVQKLFKVAIKKVNNDISKLLNFNEDEISYEKRIILMKTNELIKSKAMDKFKEYTKSGETSAKSLQYIEGILKIPFSIFKEEKIISFLSEFKKTIQNFVLTIKHNKDNIVICNKFRKLKNITSNDIDKFFDNYKIELDEKTDLNIDKILKKKKKYEIVDFIRLINNDIEKEFMININKKKKI